MLLKGAAARLLDSGVLADYEMCDYYTPAEVVLVPTALPPLFNLAVLRVVGEKNLGIEEACVDFCV